jgi:hypothetical protein
MRHDGLEFRLAKHLSWRRANPTLDKDLSGKPVSDPYVAIVKKKQRYLSAHDCLDIGDYCGYEGMPFDAGVRYAPHKARLNGMEFRWDNAEGGWWIRVEVMP